MLIIYCPKTYKNERRYVIKVIFENFLGVDYKIVFHDSAEVIVKCINDLSVRKSLHLCDNFFLVSEKDWLVHQNTLPIIPLQKCKPHMFLPEVKLVHNVLPVIYGNRFENGTFFMKRSDNSIFIGIDIIGSIFFMLSRYEEVVLKTRDKYKRFSAFASLAYKENFLERPIVNEYLEILWCSLKMLWPNLKRKKRSFKLCVSHDVDAPMAYKFSNYKSLINLKRIISKLYNQGEVINAIKQPLNFIKAKCGLYDKDPYFSFQYIMNISELHGIQSAFYFLAGHSHFLKDGGYNISHNFTRKIMKNINIRGHEIGLHGSFNSYDNPKQLKKEFNHLIKVCDEEKIQQNKWGARQHYLRWDSSLTPELLEKVGLDYDTTLTFPEHIGFRCGTCYEYPMFDLVTRKELKLIERPLIVMEGTLWDASYMGLKFDLILDKVCAIKNICRKYNGLFTLLWHNSSFISDKQRNLYNAILSN